MTLTTAHVPVLNSLLFIKDSLTKQLPNIDGIGSVWSTASCVAVGCLPDCDGPTEVILGDAGELQGETGTLVFDGTVKTPSRSISVETVLWQKLLERSVPDTTTRVRIWTDGHRDSEKIVIGLS